MREQMKALDEVEGMGDLWKSARSRTPRPESDPGPERRASSRIVAGVVALAFVVAGVVALASLGGLGRHEQPGQGPGTWDDPAFVLQVRPVIQAVFTGDPSSASLSPTCPSVEPDATCLQELMTDKPIVADSPDGSVRYVLGPPVVDGSQVVGASVPPQPQTDPSRSVSIGLDLAGTRDLARATRAAAGAQPPMDELAVLVHGSVVSVPTVQTAITSGNMQLTMPSQAAAEQLVADLAAHPAFTAVDIVDKMIETNGRWFYCSTIRKRPRYAHEQLRLTYLKSYLPRSSVPPFEDVWLELLTRC